MWLASPNTHLGRQKVKGGGCDERVEWWGEGWEASSCTPALQGGMRWHDMHSTTPTNPTIRFLSSSSTNLAQFDMGTSP